MDKIEIGGKKISCPLFEKYVKLIKRMKERDGFVVIAFEEEEREKLHNEIQMESGITDPWERDYFKRALEKEVEKMINSN